MAARAATARATRAAAAPAPRPPQRTAPRRNPAQPRRGTTRAAPRRRAQLRPTGRRARLGARLAAIPRSPFVDRLLTGRVWIVLLAALLAGIVFANVALLEMNAGIARTAEKVATLKRENSRLRLEAARLGSSERIQRAAADLGLVLPAPGQVRYLETRPEDAALALKRMSAPDRVPVHTPAPVPVEPEPVVTDPAATEPAAPEPVVTDPAAGGTTTTATTTTGQPGY